MNWNSYLFRILTFVLLMASTCSFATTKHCKHPHKSKVVSRHALTVSRHKVCHKTTKHTLIKTKKIHKKSICKKTTPTPRSIKLHKPSRVVAVAPRPPVKIIPASRPFHPIHPRRCYKDVALCCYKDVPPPPRGLRDGFYLGIEGGVDSYRIRQEQNENFPLISAIQSNPALSAVGTVGGIYGGYGKYFNQFYAGAEVLATTTGASVKYTTTLNGLNGELPASWQTNIHVNSRYGLSLLPGFKVNDSSLVYLRFGYSRLSLRTAEIENFPLRGSGSMGRTNWVNGIDYGVGIETLLYTNWSLRGEYTHTEYQSITAPGVVLNTGGGTRVPLAGLVYFPSDNQFMLGLSYHFC